MVKRVAWADEVGKSLIEEKLFCIEMDTSLRPCSRRHREGRVIAYYEVGLVETPEVKDGQVGLLSVRDYL